MSGKTRAAATGRVTAARKPQAAAGNQAPRRARYRLNTASARNRLSEYAAARKKASGYDANSSTARLDAETDSVSCCAKSATPAKAASAARLDIASATNKRSASSAGNTGPVLAP